MPIDPKEHLKECKARLKKEVAADLAKTPFVHPILGDYLFVMGQLGAEAKRADENEAYLMEALDMLEESYTELFYSSEAIAKELRSDIIKFRNQIRGTSAQD